MLGIRHLSRDNRTYVYSEDVSFTESAVASDGEHSVLPEMSFVSETLACSSSEGKISLVVTNSSEERSYSNTSVVAAL
ncbi:hypothetical protein WOLCODRAFT_151854 [Wolfiporia cocos MD-104 SS10]|uniref:Uncharacterized protein n=1 Tax=Wolfiporia cocos (strain MD-104) TaxID=742152 RepID=A0A2H3K056_WOLCO|nr:hypothetical protein WOLCODRAFT_151854 [Wolfiporia cocos MD-104 SS10]